MSSEKKPQPVCLPDKFHQFAVTSSDYSRPFLAGCYPTLEAAVRAQGGKPEKWDVFVRYSTHEATIEALRAERDEARKVCDGLHDEVQFMRNAAKEHRQRAETAEARVAQLEAALGDLMSWFPENPSPPEWRITGGEHGADEAVEHARALLSDGGRENV